MKLIKTRLQGAHVIIPEPYQDKRGMFSRIFCKKELEEIGLFKEIVQVNYSLTVKKGAIRGMHFQKSPRTEIKIVKCISGAVFDVIVDWRKGSPTFLQWHAENLSAKNMRAFYIPEGFAHGYQVLEPQSELLYFHTEFYSPEHEDGVRFNDPKLDITWPLQVTDISERDRKHQYLSDDFKGIT